LFEPGQIPQVTTPRGNKKEKLMNNLESKFKPIKGVRSSDNFKEKTERTKGDIFWKWEYIDEGMKPTNVNFGTTKKFESRNRSI